jgi:starch-binding outer membrane protein, SusD/RagB family
MRCSTNVVLVALGLLLGTGGCNGFLTGDKLSQNPNQPASPSLPSLFVGLQVGQFALQEGTVPMMVCEWMQQCAGINGRFVDALGRYDYDETSNIVDWAQVYGSGGLVDEREDEALARASGDSVWLGIVKIWEAFTVGTAADQWGNIPYSQAVSNNLTPSLDSGFVVYAAVQGLLSEAIAEFQCTAPTCAGPGPLDMVFGGDRQKWAAAAHTLKARYFMHTAESLGTPAYQAAIAEALLGISDASGASDFKSLHTSATSERNLWAQFQFSSGFGSDLVAGKFLADFMNARSDPRRAQYFCKNALGTYGGQDYGPNQPSNTVSNFSGAGCTNRVSDGTFGQPYVTYAENELILAEAYTATGDSLNAILHLNNERVAAGLAAIPAPGVPMGQQMIDSVMYEKYVALFQNIEVIMDYRRTCRPKITPAAPAQTNFLIPNVVPGRLFYSQAERNVNSNVPLPSTQLNAHGFRNPGDVSACPFPPPP